MIFKSALPFFKYKNKNQSNIFMKINKDLVRTKTTHRFIGYNNLLKAITNTMTKKIELVISKISLIFVHLLEKFIAFKSNFAVVQLQFFIRLI